MLLGEGHEAHEVDQHDEDVDHRAGPQLVGGGLADGAEREVVGRSFDDDVARLLQQQQVAQQAARARVDAAEGQPPGQLGAADGCGGRGAEEGEEDVEPAAAHHAKVITYYYVFDKT